MICSVLADYLVEVIMILVLDNLKSLLRSGDMKYEH